jgi:chromosome segregation ATPase
MSASDLPENSLDHRQRPGPFRRLLGLFQRNEQTELSRENIRDGRANIVPTPNQLREDRAGEMAPQTSLDDLHGDPAGAFSAEAETQARLAEAQAELRARTEQVQALTGELESVHLVLADREVMLQSQQNMSEEQRGTIEMLQVANETLEAELRATQVKIERIEVEQNNSQAALTASIQHAAEQQDALLRWQEMAESAGECVSTLEEQVRHLQQALHDCNNQREDLHQELEATSQALSEAQARLELLNRHEDTVSQLAEARSRIVELEEVLEQDAEVLARYKTSLANSQRALERMEQRLGEQVTALKITQSKLVARETTIARSRAVFERLAAALRLKEESKQRLQTQLNQRTVQAREERALWYKTLKRNEQQLALTETELDRFYQSYRVQGQRMAEIQATLLQREQELASAKAQMKQQTQLLHHLRRAADGRILDLETALNQAEQRIHDLQLVIERRVKRESVSSEQ